MLRALLRKGLLDVLAANALMQLVGFATLLVLPRLVSTEVFGSIRVLQSIGDLLVVAGGFGYGTAILSTCSRPGADDLHFPVLRSATNRTIAASLASWAVAGGLALAGAFSATPSVGAWLPWFAASIPFVAGSQLYASFLQARSRLPEMARAQGLVKIQSTVLILAATWAFGMTGFVAAWVVAAAVGLIPFLTRIGTDFLKVESAAVTSEFRRIARHGVSANALQIAGRYADLFVLGLFVPDAEALGPYALATVLILPVFVLAASVQAASIPGFAAGRDQPSGLTRSVTRTTLETITAAIVMALVTRLVAPSLIAIVYDSAYMATIPYLEILLIHAVFRSATSVIGGAHIALGRTGFNVAGSAISAVLGFSLGAIALWKYGLPGVAWAQVATSVVLAALYPLFFMRAVR